MEKFSSWLEIHPNQMNEPIVSTPFFVGGRAWLMAAKGLGIGRYPVTSGNNSDHRHAGTRNGVSRQDFNMKCEGSSDFVSV